MRLESDVDLAAAMGITAEELKRRKKKAIELPGERVREVSSRGEQVREVLAPPPVKEP